MMIMARPGWLFATLALAWATVSSPSVAASLDDSVRNEVSRRVPAWWRVDRVTIGDPRALASSENGASSRFGAEVRLSAPTFSPELRAGAETFVRRAGDPGMVKAVSGEVRMSRSGRIEVTLDESLSLLDSLGKPESALPGRVVSIDGEEGKALLASIPERERARGRAVEEAGAAVAAADAAEAKAAEAIKAAIDAGTKRLGDLIDRLNSRERAERLAAYREVSADPDPARRALAAEAALKSRDPIMTGLALRDWLTRRETVSVLLYAVKEEPESVNVIHNIGPLKLSISEIDASGGITGALSAPGYAVTRDAAAGGGLTRDDLQIVTFGCSLDLRLTERRTLDGVYRCQTLPPLAARVVLD